MKIIIPMAGMGKRMRPHTLTIPKPLIPVGGKPIVYRLVEDIASLSDEKIDEIAFIIGDFGKEVEKNLIEIAESVGAKASIYYQKEALGTAHAILCAEPTLSGHIIVAFADTLFQADFKIDTSLDGIIWTKRINDPASFGVVETDSEGIVKRFWEKPTEFVSDQAIIGIYYFNDGEYLKKQLRRLIDEDLKVKGEYQITDALDNMRKSGSVFKTADVIHWLDCGNKDATVLTNRMVLELNRHSPAISKEAKISNSIINEPCFIDRGVTIIDSVVGPYVSIGENSTIKDSVVKNTIILGNTKINGANLENSMIGNFSVVEGHPDSLNLGDFSEIR
jgi:glucose-1-phosphate thymidylyltransferase